MPWRRATASREPEAFGIAARPAFHRPQSEADARARRSRRSRLEPHHRRRSRTRPGVRAARSRDAHGARRDRSRAALAVTAGIADLVIMKTSHSAFAGFPRDEFTTLPETQRSAARHGADHDLDRTRDADVEFGPAFRAVRTALLEAFAQHDSLSVQHTLYAMGQARARHRSTSSRASRSRCRTGITCRSISRGSAWRTATRSSSPPKSRTA